jgi:hypothetical protein
MTWQPIATGLPKAGEPVLVVVQTPRPCVMIAQWAPRFTLPLHSDAEGGEYDEARDEYFADEGWYQCYQVNGSLDDEPFWLIQDDVTHWMPLPDPCIQTSDSMACVHCGARHGEAHRCLVALADPS